jgi:hypothetical protein
MTVLASMATCETKEPSALRRPRGPVATQAANYLAAPPGLASEETPPGASSEGAAMHAPSRCQAWQCVDQPCSYACMRAAAAASRLPRLLATAAGGGRYCLSIVCFLRSGVQYFRKYNDI